jgi:HK97 gp10 family phage protein
VTSIKVSVGTEGFYGLTEHLRKLPAEIKAKARKAVATELKAAREDAKERVPVRTGKLKKSIRVKMSKDGIAGELKAGGPGAHHAHLVERGTRRTRAKPYLNPAADAANERLFDALAAIVDEALQ